MEEIEPQTVHVYAEGTWVKMAARRGDGSVIQDFRLSPDFALWLARTLKESAARITGWTE